MQLQIAFQHVDAAEFPLALPDDKFFPAGLTLCSPLPHLAPAGADDDPYLLSWRGIDAGAYYQQDPEAYVRLLNYRCGPAWAAGLQVCHSRCQRSAHLLSSSVDWKQVSWWGSALQLCPRPSLSCCAAGAATR